MIQTRWRVAACTSGCEPCFGDPPMPTGAPDIESRRAAWRRLPARLAHPAPCIPEEGSPWIYIQLVSNDMCNFCKFLKHMSFILRVFKMWMIILISRITESMYIAPAPWSLSSLVKKCRWCRPQLVFKWQKDTAGKDSRHKKWALYSLFKKFSGLCLL